MQSYRLRRKVSKFGHIMFIYNAVEEITLALEGLLEPETVEETLGRAQVQEAFKIPKIGVIAGSKVTEGIIVSKCKSESTTRRRRNRFGRNHLFETYLKMMQKKSVRALNVVLV